MASSALTIGPLLAPVQVNVHEARTQLSRLLQQVEAGQEVFVSQAPLWGMAIKTSLGRLQTEGSMQRVDGHRDPFDRLLVAQSRCEPLAAERRPPAGGLWRDRAARLIRPPVS